MLAAKAFATPSWQSAATGWALLTSALEKIYRVLWLQVKKFCYQGPDQNGSHAFARETRTQWMRNTTRKESTCQRPTGYMSEIFASPSHALVQTCQKLEQLKSFGTKKMTWARAHHSLMMNAPGTELKDVPFSCFLPPSLSPSPIKTQARLPPSSWAIVLKTCRENFQTMAWIWYISLKCVRQSQTASTWMLKSSTSSHRPPCLRRERTGSAWMLPRSFWDKRASAACSLRMCTGMRCLLFCYKKLLHGHHSFNSRKSQYNKLTKNILISVLPVAKQCNNYMGKSKL